MSSDGTSDFHNLHAAEHLKFVRHNPTDFEAFRKFQEELDLKFSGREAERERKDRKKNLETWSSLIGPRWAGASLKNIENEASIEVVTTLKNEHLTSFFIMGESNSGKSYLAYAILHAMIFKGWTTPSQVERISEEALKGMAGTGFEGMGRFTKLLAPRYKVYLFDGVGTKKTYTDKEQQLWEQLIDHIYTESLTAVFTSNVSMTEFGLHLSDSGYSKLQHIVGNREIESKSTWADRESNSRLDSSKKHGDAPTPAFGTDGTLL